ncbi:MAG: hypothetical protein OSJ43_06425 [Oscillospiraceae bacterium]|nr:hypothetical protein [Oscillospiraceae bacterium]
MEEKTYTIIEVPDMNDSFSRIVIQGKPYYLRLTYNDTFGYWTFGVYNSLYEPIREGIKIVPKMALNLFCGTMNMPNGVFGVITELEKVSRKDFVEGRAKFIFASAE